MWVRNNVTDGGTGTLAQRPPNAWNDTWTDRLKKDLLFNYDKFARPAQHTNTTVVNLFVIIRHVSLVSVLTSVPPYNNKTSICQCVAGSSYQ